MISLQVAGQLSILTGPVFFLHELGTDLKNTGFHFYVTYTYINVTYK